MTETSHPPTAMPSFEQLGLPDHLLATLAEVGYETPSPIQAMCIPHLLAGHDLLGEAQTGTGKTAAFALPILVRLDLASKEPQALVLTPTRELALQVSEAFTRYARHLRNFHVLPIYGGQSMVVQLRQLARGAQVIVGTPGRIMDHLERGSLKFDALSMLVLDEADEMLRMGFIDDVEWILEHTPSTRQTALFSATLPAAIRGVAHRHLREPEEVRIRAATTTVEKIRQRYWLVRGVDKLDALTRILDAEEKLDAALVFVRTKIGTEELADKLAARGYAAAALNGDMTQGLRERVIEQLKNGSLDIVVATDVAARGIDVPRISHVINYDIPYDTEAYVHRIGRTGRAGREGVAILFVAPRERRMLKSIEHATRQPIEPIALPSREDVSSLRISQFKQKVLDTLADPDMEPGFFMNVVEEIVEENDLSSREVAAALAYLVQVGRPLQIEEEEGRGWEQATVLHPQGKPPRRESFVADAPRTRGARRDRNTTDAVPEKVFASGKTQRYRIAVGRDHGVTPREIVGAIANEGGIEGKLIGQIDLFNDFSTVELPALPSGLLATLKRIVVCNRPLDMRPFREDEALPARRPRSAVDSRRDDRSHKAAAKPWEKQAREKQVQEKRGGREKWISRSSGESRPSRKNAVQQGGRSFTNHTTSWKKRREQK
ncbi:MAG: DEAD/DEAH box helicase [Betaproteobacteria bacterium]|nr:DEAD/DEAH box helicase [Betaproteobacteria bacterium]